MLGCQTTSESLQWIDLSFATTLSESDATKHLSKVTFTFKYLETSKTLTSADEHLFGGGRDLKIKRALEKLPSLNSNIGRSRKESISADKTIGECLFHVDYFFLILLPNTHGGNFRYAIYIRYYVA